MLRGKKKKHTKVMLSFCTFCYISLHDWSEALYLVHSDLTEMVERVQALLRPCRSYFTSLPCFAQWACLLLRFCGYILIGAVCVAFSFIHSADSFFLGIYVCIYLFVYMFIWERAILERSWRRGTCRLRLSMEPDAGPDPTTLRPWPEPNSTSWMPSWLSYPDTPQIFFFCVLGIMLNSKNCRSELHSLFPQGAYST